MNSICIVIPFYNEAMRFRVDEFLEFVSRHPEISFCFVDDGSTDGTGIILDSIRARFPEQILVITQQKNAGKAEAVRSGMLNGLDYFYADFYGYFDADLSAPLDEALRLRDMLSGQPSLEFAFGSRLAIVGMKIERKLYRHLVGRIIATFISRILHLVVYDTQCGAKLFTRSLVPQLFTDPFISRWLFDVEIFARIIQITGRENSEKKMVEVPVRSWIDRGGSKISWTYGFRLFYDLFRIRRQYHFPGKP